MKFTSRTLLALGAAALLLPGCSKITAIRAAALKSGTANFSVYAAMGTSFSSGYQSSGLVVTHQVKSFPYLFAQQAGAASFTIPSVSADGIPPLLKLVTLSPPVISNAGRTLGTATNSTQATAYHNMGIPGAVLFDVGDESAYYSSPNAVGRTNFTFFNIIARHAGTILAQVASLSPTFISFEYGINELLGPATSGSGTLPVTPAQFGALLTGTLNGLQQACPNAKVAMLNIPGVTSLPFFTTFPPFVLDASGNPVLDNLGNPITLIGSENGTTGPLGPGDRVLLTAGDLLAVGTGFPTGTFSYLTGAPGNNQPLPDAVVLSASEASSIQGGLDAYNAAIATEASARGFALVDINALLDQAATVGLNYQGTVYTSDFVTGGLFSLDGIHPNDLAHGVACNAMIEAVNAKFGSNIPLLTLSTVASGSSSRARFAGPGRSLPWIRGSATMLEPLFPWRKGPAL